MPITCGAEEPIKIQIMSKGITSADCMIHAEGTETLEFTALYDPRRFQHA